MSLGQSKTEESEDELLSLGSPTIDEGGSSGGNSGTGTVMLKKGPWTSSEDAILVEYVKKHGEGNWNAVQKYSGLSRCGKSCRLRWANHLRPNLKKGGFTPEEEHLIIELHAKMGNKWARMAAHMPGRTDNEIKNYWNTRIKRHQRAGLPLYPPELCVQEYQENQAYQNDEDKGHNNPSLHSNNYDISNVLYTNLRNNQGFIPYMPPLPEFSCGNSLMRSMNSSPLLYSFINPRKRIRESEQTLSDYEGGTQFDTNRDPPNQDSQSLINGNNFSESKPPIIGAMNMELPSFQYQETNFSTCFSNPSLPALESVDTFIQSGPTPLTNCPSPRSSGLLEALVFSSSKNPSSEKSLNSSSTVTPTDLIEYEGYGNSNSPFGNNVKSEPIDYSWNVEEEKNELNPMRPDVLLASCWSGGPTNMSYAKGSIAAAIFGEHMGGETSNTLDFDSCLVDEHTCM